MGGGGYNSDGLAAERQKLRGLLDSFSAEPELLLERSLGDPRVRRTIGKFIGHTLVKPYLGER